MSCFSRNAAQNVAASAKIMLIWLHHKLLLPKDRHVGYDTAQNAANELATNC
jgi:hypothetical protein